MFWSWEDGNAHMECSGHFKVNFVGVFLHKWGKCCVLHIFVRSSLSTVGRSHPTHAEARLKVCFPVGKRLRVEENSEDGHGRRHRGKQALRRWKAPAFLGEVLSSVWEWAFGEMSANPFGMSGLRTAACSVTGQKPRRILTHRLSYPLRQQAWSDIHYWIKHSLLSVRRAEGFPLTSSSSWVSGSLLVAVFPSLPSSPLPRLPSFLLPVLAFVFALAIQ